MRHPGWKGAPKPKQWPKIITRRRVPAQTMRRSRQPAFRYLESAGGGRWRDYSLRGAPHPRAAERIFPWRVSMSPGRVPSYRSRSGHLSCPPAGSPQAPVSFPRGPISPPSAHAGSPS